MAIATPPGAARVFTSLRTRLWGVERAATLTLSPWPRRLGACLLILGSAWPASLGTFANLTVTGDRILGVTALAMLGTLAVVGRLRWTAAHTALAVFVGVQLLATAINARTWTSGPKSSSSTCWVSRALRSPPSAGVAATVAAG